jgi:hypothetical protein
MRTGLSLRGQNFFYRIKIDGSKSSPKQAAVGGKKRRITGEWVIKNPCNSLNYKALAS